MTPLHNRHLLSVRPVTVHLPGPHRAGCTSGPRCGKEKKKRPFLLFVTTGIYTCISDSIRSSAPDSNPQRALLGGSLGLQVCLLCERSRPVNLHLCLAAVCKLLVQGLDRDINRRRGAACCPRMSSAARFFPPSLDEGSSGAAAARELAVSFGSDKHCRERPCRKSS